MGIQLCSQGNTLPLAFQVQRNVIGIGAVGEVYHVVGLVYDAVRTIISPCLGIVGSTNILIDQHTRTYLVFGHFHVGAISTVGLHHVLVEVFVNVLEGTEHADALHTPQAEVCAVSIGNLTIDIVVLPVHHLHLIVGNACIQADAVLEVLANLVAPGQRELPTPVVYLTQIGSSTTGTYRGGNFL